MVTDRYEFCNDCNIVRNFLFWHCVDLLHEHTVCRLRHSHRPRGMAPRKDHAALKYSCRVSRWQPTLAVRSPIQLTVWFGLSRRRKNPGSCRTHPHHGRVGSNRGLYFLACLAFFIQAQCANKERIRFGIGSACWVNSWLDGLAKVRTRGREVVKAALTAYPDAVKTPGPHGISLIAHAEAGGDEAKSVLDYLNSRT